MWPVLMIALPGGSWAVLFDLEFDLKRQRLGDLLGRGLTKEWRIMFSVLIA